jgi:hypothetical protein
MTHPLKSKEIARECAEKIARLTGYGTALHVNDIIPDILQALTQREEGMVMHPKGSVCVCDTCVKDEASREEALIAAVEGMKNDMTCELEETFGYHGKDCWDDCLEKRVHNATLDAVLTLLRGESKGEGKCCEKCLGKFPSQETVMRNRLASRTINCVKENCPCHPNSTEV